MTYGSGLAGLLPVAMMLAGIISVMRTRVRKRSGGSLKDQDFERRRVEAAEMERRMASYLAGRETGRGYAAANDEQEIRR